MICNLGDPMSPRHPVLTCHHKYWREQQRACLHVWCADVVLCLLILDTLAHTSAHTHTHEQAWFGLKDMYILCFIQIHKLTFHHKYGRKQQCTCLPTNVVTSLLVFSHTEKHVAAASCRSEPSRARGGVSAAARIPWRCEDAWSGTLRGAVCFASANVLPSGSDMCVYVWSVHWMVSCSTVHVRTNIDCVHKPKRC